MSPRPAPESARRPHQTGDTLRPKWVRLPKLTAAIGVTAALGLGAWSWAGHAQLSGGQSPDSAIPSAAETLGSIEQAGYESLSGEGSGGIERVEYQSPDEIPAPPAESAPAAHETVGASYLEAGEEVSSESAAGSAVSDDATDTLDPMNQPVTPDDQSVAPDDSVPESEAAATDAAEAGTDPQSALPANEALPELPQDSRLRDLADGVAQGSEGEVQLQPVGPAAPEKPTVAVSTADLCRKYSPRNIREVRLAVAPNAAGALPTDKGDPASSCFPQGSELAGTDTWYETTCYGKYLFICHDPLYFEDQVAERYGEHWGKWVQPAVSAGKFFGAVPMAPYRFFANSLSEEAYSQDNYGQTRNGYADGTFIPPFHAGAAALTAGAVTGLYFLIP